MTVMFVLWLLAGHPQVIQTPSPNHTVMVLHCKSMKLATVFNDEHMTTPMPNPLVSGNSSVVTFTVPKSGCYEIVDMEPTLAR